MSFTSLCFSFVIHKLVIKVAAQRVVEGIKWVKLDTQSITWDIVSVQYMLIIIIM